MNVSPTAIRGVEAELERLKAENDRLRSVLAKVVQWALDEADLWRDDDYGDSEHVAWWEENAKRWEHHLQAAAAATDEHDDTCPAAYPDNVWHPRPCTCGKAATDEQETS